jgi:hypothetical protein
MINPMHVVTADSTVQMIHNGRFKRFRTYLVFIQFNLLQLQISSLYSCYFNLNPSFTYEYHQLLFYEDSFNFCSVVVLKLVARIINHF